MTRIIITERPDDYHACLDGSPRVWGCGETPSAAIGDLVRSHPERFGVEIDATALDANEARP